MAGCHSSGDSDPQTGEQLVFVYGTLMRGMANHRHLAGAPCLGTAELAGFALYDLGPFPMAIASGDRSHTTCRKPLSSPRSHGLVRPANS